MKSQSMTANLRVILSAAIAALPLLSAAGAAEPADAPVHALTQAAQTAQKSGATSAAVLQQSGIVKYTTGMTMNALVGRPNTDFVELSDGQRVRVGDLRRLEAAAQKMRTPARGGVPSAFRVQPASTGTRLNNAADLGAALRRSDNETVQLPSGRLATVGQIKFVMPKVEQRLGHPLSAAPNRPNLSGPALKISKSATKDEWKGILQKPDNTVIESPNGTRITVGELKQALRTTPAPPAPRQP
jgi:hypothetical protein